MATLGQDLRYAIRRMKRTPGFTAVAIATLALGLGLNSAVESGQRAFPETSAARRCRAAGAGRPVPGLAAWSSVGFSLSYPDYLHYRDHARTFADLQAHYPTSPMHVSTADGGFDLTGSVVTANYFHVLRLKPALGRFFSADEDQVPDRHPVAVLSQDLWRNRFGADPQILDAVVRINGTSFTIVGVAPEESPRHRPRRDAHRHLDSHGDVQGGVSILRWLVAGMQRHQHDRPAARVGLHSGCPGRDDRSRATARGGVSRTRTKDAERW